MRTYTRKRPEYQLIEDVHELCRLCLGKGEGVVPIFPDDASNVCVLALRVMICVGIELKREELLPNIICTDCLNSLNKYYAFRKKCEVSYQRLKSHVLAVKEKQYKMKIEEQNNIKTEENTSNTNEEDDMNFVVKFDKEHIPEVSLLKINADENSLTIRDQQTNNSNNNMDSLENNSLMQNGEEQISQSIDTPSPDLTTFLSTMLTQLGILTHQEDGLVVLQQNVNTLELETGDGSQMTLELVEEYEDELAVEENVTMEQPLPTIELDKVTDQNNILLQSVTSKYKWSRPPKNNKDYLIGDIQKNGTWCIDCGKQFASRSALNRHRRTHSGERPYPCTYCGRRFAQKEVMQRHALIHTEQRPFQCTSCPKSFTQRSALAAHTRAHAPPDARALALHRCSRCPKVFLYASGLSRHMMMHSGRVYVCGACARQFKDKSSLMRHLKNANHPANT